MKKSGLFLLVFFTGLLFAGCGGNQEQQIHKILPVQMRIR